jgi:hypothetical protein
MSEDDRLRWNEKYTLGDHAASEPSQLLTNLDVFLPKSGRAIDVGGGAGRHAVWLARRGLDALVADVSEVALQLAEARATEAGVSIATQRIDFEADPFPPGPWDLIVSVHFLWRPLFDIFATSVISESDVTLARFQRPTEAARGQPSESSQWPRPCRPAVLSPGGTLVCIHPTRTNLQRHPKPSLRHLLEDGELPRLVKGLEVIHYEEGWLAEGRHEAVLVALAAGKPASNE